jgi:hypothetical protein
MKTLNLKKKVKGFAISSELIFLSTIVTAGLAVGMVNIRDGVVGEMNDVSVAIGSLNQSFSYDGMLNDQTTAEVAGSIFVDTTDANAGDLGSWDYIVPVVDEASTAAFGATATTIATDAAGNQ